MCVMLTPPLSRALTTHDALTDSNVHTMCVLDGSGGVCDNAAESGDPGNPANCDRLRFFDCRLARLVANELPRWRPLVGGESGLICVTDAWSDKSPAALVNTSSSHFTMITVSQLKPSVPSTRSSKYK